MSDKPQAWGCEGAGGVTPHTSKSAAKREAAAARRLGAELAALEPGRRRNIPMSEALNAALDAYRGFSSHEARRRQLQFIGRLMRGEDRHAIAAGLARAKGLTPAEHALNRELERWRERLLNDGDALTDYLRAHPQANAQALRQLIRRSKRTVDEKARSELHRRLFRLLRENAERDVDGGDGRPPGGGSV